MMKVFHDKYIPLKKHFKRDKDKTIYQDKLRLFKENGDKIFDIAACNCVMEGDKYSCPKQCKVPERERKFLRDQRTQR